MISGRVCRDPHSLIPLFHTERSPYQMTLSMTEPPPIILLHRTLQGSTTAVLHVRIEGLNSRFLAGSALQDFHKLKFWALLGLRLKTFYSTRPFPRFPCQALLTVEGPIRLQDQVICIGEQSHSSNTWSVAQMPKRAEVTTQVSLAPEEGANRNSIKSQSTADSHSDYSEAWQATFNLPLTVPGHLLPTFCSAIASRQYSLITRIHVDGIRIDRFVLEVPLQITFSPVESLQAAERVSTPEGYEGNFAPNRPHAFTIWSP